MAWRDATEVDPHGNRSAVWFKAEFDRPDTGLADAPQTAFALDLSSLNKGVVYVNGFNIGRHWLEVGRCSGDCAPPSHGKVQLSMDPPARGVKTFISCRLTPVRHSPP